MQANFRTTKPWLHYGILAFFYAIGFVTLASHTVLHALEMHGHAQASAVTCNAAPKRTHVLRFEKTAVTPRTLTADVCDRITVVNATGEELTAAIGPHSHHAHYPGFEETSLQPGATYSFRATERGTFPIHDHDNAVLAATMIVRD